MAKKLPKLLDLSAFGIHIMNPEGRCCRCKQGLGAYCRGIYADSLCRNCDQVSVKGRDGRRIVVERREAFFYRQGSVYVLPPREVLEPGYRVPTVRLECIVVIDGVPYTGRSMWDTSVSLYDMNERLVREHGLDLTKAHLVKLYRSQQSA